MTEQIFSTLPLAQGNQFYLERPRIHSLLEKAIDSPVITVIAGAGYGKTQAVYSFLQGYEALTAWTQFSQRDNIQERFWENFTAAIGFVSKESARRLAETGFPNTERDFDRYLTIPQEDVIPEARYIFVYDDFHLIENQEVLRFLKQSIAIPFPNIRSIIISRTEPDINTAALDSRRIRTTITEEDLRFTVEETAAYFRAQGLNMSHNYVSSVCRDTEGWAFAIHLSSLFLKHLPVPNELKEGHRLPGMRSNIYRLLETEVMETVSPAARHFLIKLSLIDILPRELLEILDKGGTLLAEIDRIGSFIRYDPTSKTYSIHHLFLEYLMGRQGELKKQEKRNLYRTAAAWCEKNDRKTDAISYYEKAGDYHSIMVIFGKLPQILPNHIAGLIKELLDRTPESQFKANPLLEILYGKVYISLGLFDECTGRLRNVIDDTEASLGKGGQKKEIKYQVLLNCYLNLGTVGLITSTTTGDYRFVEYYKKAAAYSALSGQVPRPPVTVANIGSYVCRVRDAEKAVPYLAALEEIVPLAAEALGGNMYGMDKLARGEYAYFRGDLREAESCIREALVRARERQQYEIESRSLFYLLRIAIHRENHGEIPALLRDLSLLKEQEGYANRGVHHDIIMGWFYTQIGDTEKLAPWLKNDFEDSDINSRGQGLEILVKAKYHLCEKKYPAALASLISRNDFEAGLLFGKIETLALEAVCRYNARDREGALNVLKQLYHLTEQSRVAMPLVELGRSMRSLADWALKEAPQGIGQEWLLEQRRNAAGYAKKLFSSTVLFRERTRPAPRRSPTQQILSRREQEVLSCLSRGLTRAEIAGALSLSINTVKSIIRSIYNKLGAVNRSNAVQAAAAAGLLEGRD